MKIDWKAVAQSPGYRSLKAHYIQDAHEAGQRARPMRKKAEFLKLFNWAISRAKHYAVRQNRTIEEVLNEWESSRNKSWWLNMYGEGYQPKFPSGKPRNVQHRKPETYIKSTRYKSYSKKEKITRLQHERMRTAKFAREKLGKKPRLSPERKRRLAAIRGYLKEKASV